MTENEAGTPTQGDTVSQRILSNVIGSIYDCALDPSRWEDTLAEIAQAMSGGSVILSLNDLRNDRLLIDRNVGEAEAYSRNPCAAE
jgi:hypothetical protein